MSRPMQQVTVAVPSERVPEFYEMYGRWLREGGRGPAGIQPLSGGIVAALDDNLLLDFASARSDVIEAWWALLSKNAKRLLLFLAGQPGKQFGGVELAVACKVGNGAPAVAGTLSWPTSHARTLGLKFPWGWNREQQKYWMSKEAAIVVAGLAH